MTISKKPSFTLTAGQFQKLLGEGNWTPRDIPQSEWQNFPAGMVDQAVAFVVSGTLIDADHRSLNGIANAVGGLDFLRPETNPRSNEKDGNAYHFVFVKREQEYSAYCFKNQTAIGHEFNYEDLAIYFDDL